MDRIEILNELSKYKDKNYMEFSKKLVTSKHKMLGVRIPKLKELSNKFDLFDLDENLTFEEIMLYGFILARDKDIDFQKITDFLKYVDNWSVCDSFACKLKKNKSEDFYNDSSFRLLRSCSYIITLIVKKD